MGAPFLFLATDGRRSTQMGKEMEEDFGWIAAVSIDQPQRVER